MSKIRGISHVVLYVNDLDRMVAFYRDMLGLIKYRENPGRMVFLTPDPDIDDHQIALAKGEKATPSSSVTLRGASIAPPTSRHSMKSSRPQECPSITVSVMHTRKWEIPSPVISLIRKATV